MPIGSWDESKLYLSKTIEEIKQDLHFMRKEQLDTRERLSNVAAQLSGIDAVKSDLKIVQEKVVVIQTKLMAAVAIVGIVSSAIVQWVFRHI